MSTPPPDKAESIALGTGLPPLPPEAPHPKQGSLNGREVTATPPQQAVTNEFLRQLNDERRQRESQHPPAAARPAITKEPSQSRIVTFNDLQPPQSPQPLFPTFYGVPTAIPPPPYIPVLSDYTSPPTVPYQPLDPLSPIHPLSSPPPQPPVLPPKASIYSISLQPVDPDLLRPVPPPPSSPILQPPRPIDPKQPQAKQGGINQIHVGITILALSVLAMAAAVTVGALKYKGLLTHEFTLLGYTYNTASVVTVTLCIVSMAGLLGGFLTIISRKETDEEIEERLVEFGKKHGLDLQAPPSSIEALYAQQNSNSASATSKS